MVWHWQAHWMVRRLFACLLRRRWRVLPSDDKSALSFFSSSQSVKSAQAQHYSLFSLNAQVATGLSDADLEAHHAFFSEHVLPGPRPYYSVSPTTKPPDVWLDAVQVWEVKGADLTISPAYTAASGLVDKTRGVSLRFPRFLRVRTDKRPEDATHAEQVAQLYSKQTLCIAKPQRADEEDEEN